MKLISSVVLALLVAQLLASTPESAMAQRKFRVFDMPEDQQIQRWGRVPDEDLTPEDWDAISTDIPYHADVFRVLAVLTEWDDRPGTYSRESFQELLFSRNVLPQGSLADYVDEISFGQLAIAGDVIDWFNAGPSFDVHFDYTVLFEQLDPLVDYSQYDGNSDNKVDLILFIRAGNGQEDSQDPNDSWTFVSYGYSAFLARCDGVMISNYSCCPETRPTRDPNNPFLFSGESIQNGIRIYAHEMMHVIGLPDLYDTDSKLDVSTYNNAADDNNHPLMDWCLMGYYGYGYFSLGSHIPSHPCGWSKMLLRWIEPITLEGEYTDLVLYDIETHKDQSLYRIPIGRNSSEYFLLEYRNPYSSGLFDKFDSDFSTFFWPDLTYGYDPMDRGLLITHVDDSLMPQTGWTSTNRGTPLSPHYMICVEDAGYDPSRPETYNPEGHVTDSAQWWYPWECRKRALFSSDVPGQDEFGPETTPSSAGYYSDSRVYVRVDSIVDDRLYLYVNTDLPVIECCLNRGDADHNGQVDPLDLVFLADYMWKGGDEPPCEDEADIDGSGSIDGLDAAYLLAYFYRSGTPPPPCPQ